MKSFYHYIMKFRSNKKHDRMGEFARSAYNDHSFPKSSTDYDELSSYLELNGHYLSSMTVFDEAWELYQNNA
ncbi:YozE family protein [Priestia aryabhattai]|uniref:YozE family protein n=1 Tax=Priestia aryabhattai TaxID=412384 RepID=UPI003D2C58D5